MAIVNITCENDADFYRQFAYQTTLGVPIDLTGNTLRMGIRKHAADVEEELLLTTENGALAIVDATNGIFTVRILSSQLLQQLAVGDYEHSLIRIITVSSERYRIWSGTLTNTAGPSR
jgi:hypothetical protein